MRRFVLPIAASLALVLAAPFIGQLRAALQDVFPDQYRAIILTAVFGSIAVAVAAAVIKIRDRRVLRYACIVAALTLGTTYAWLSRTGDPAVDAVERFHFVEYGLIALLFYRAWRFDSHSLAQGKSISDGSLFILPVLAALLVGIAEEWLQWFVPARVGELRDIVLNLWAIGCGVLIAVAMDPPARMSLRLPPASWQRVRRFAAAVLIAFAVFLHSVHLGFAIDDAKTGSFRSGYDRDTLVQLAQERAARWRSHPPLTWSRLSREDQYLTEGITHVRRRNRCWDEKNFNCSWHENLILEEYFAPVLDTPTYVSSEPHRWPPEQRADLERRENGAQAYSSEADEVRILTWPKPVFWSIVGIAAVLLLW